MTDEELKQQEQQEDKKEGKEENKSLIKKIILGVVIFLLLSGIIFLILFGVSKCSNKNKGGSSSSEPANSEKYSSSDIDNVFKKIVKASLNDNGVDISLPELTDVVTVTYEDNHSSFDLSISIKSSTNRVFYYSVTNKTYSNHEDFLGYLLDKDTNLLLDASSSIDNYAATSDTITTDKTNNKYIVSESPTNIKYFSGFYFENNEYRVYQKKELLNENPFSEPSSKVIRSGDLLFGYYSFLLIK